MKILCLYNKDSLDGWLGAAIVKEWFIEEYGDIRKGSVGGLIFDLGKENNPYGSGTNTLSLMGVNDGGIIHILERYDKVVLVNFPYRDNGVEYISLPASRQAWEYFFPDREVPEVLDFASRTENGVLTIEAASELLNALLRPTARSIGTFLKK